MNECNSGGLFVVVMVIAMMFLTTASWWFTKHHYAYPGLYLIGLFILDLSILWLAGVIYVICLLVRGRG